MLTQYCHRCDKLIERNLAPYFGVCATDEQEKECPNMINQAFAPNVQEDTLDEVRDNRRMKTKKKASSQRFKADAGKPDPTLLEKGCPHALAVVQATLDYGNIKYTAHSWKNVPDGMQRYDAAARRHRNKRDLGQQNDDESWLDHLGHEIINNLFLLEMMIVADPGKTWTKFNPNPPQEHKNDQS